MVFFLVFKNLTEFGKFEVCEWRKTLYNERVGGEIYTHMIVL